MKPVGKEKGTPFYTGLDIDGLDGRMSGKPRDVETRPPLVQA